MSLSYSLSLDHSLSDTETLTKHSLTLSCSGAVVTHYKWSEADENAESEQEDEKEEEEERERKAEVTSSLLSTRNPLLRRSPQKSIRFAHKRVYSVALQI